MHAHVVCVGWCVCRGVWYGVCCVCGVCVCVVCVCVCVCMCVCVSVYVHVCACVCGVCVCVDVVSLSSRVGVDGFCISLGRPT